jgi:hypothetical protein
VMEQKRRRPFVDLQNKTRSRHDVSFQIETKTLLLAT